MGTRLLATWWREVRWLVIAFVPLAILFATTDADLAIAKALFFDGARGGWIGAHNWWVEAFLHTGGRWAIRLVVVAAIACWAASFFSTRLAPVRRPVGYFAMASVLGIGIVGLLKTLTNVDCPWDLLPFGGQFPVVPLFAHRPDGLRMGQCFPAAHASSGYALIALYFAARERSRAVSRWGLALGIACGLAFGLAQQSRGAHFMSHDLWSALLVWVIAAAVYVVGFGARVHGLGVVEVLDGSSPARLDRCAVVRR